MKETAPGARFVLVGLVELVDVDERRLSIGGRDVWVAEHVRLEDLTLGTRAVVSGKHESADGRPCVDRIVFSLSPAPHQASRWTAPGRRRSDEADSPRILSLVLSLLVELRSEVQVLECTPLPSEDRYAIRLEIPGEVGKAVLLPRRALERALVDPVALRTVRNFLRASVKLLRSQRALSEARFTLYTTAMGQATWSGPRCAQCEGPLVGEDPVVVEGESRWHMACPPPW